MDNLKPPRPLCLEGDLAGNWKRWKQQFNIYLIASGGTEKDDAIKIATLLHVLGEEVQDLYFTLEVPAADAKKYDSVLAHLDSYFLPQTNQSVERHRFNNRVQEENESFDAFIMALRRLSTNCGYEAIRDDLIKDRIVCGVRDTRIKDRLLREPKLTLTKAVQICKAAEQTQVLMKAIDNDEAVHAVRRTYRQEERRDTFGKLENGTRQPHQPFRRGTEFGEKYTSDQLTEVRSQHGEDNWHNGLQKQPSSEAISHKQYSKEGRPMYDKKWVNSCYRCGRNHFYSQCPALNVVCYNCNKRGHFSRMCRSQSQREGGAVNVLTDTSNDLLLGCVTSVRQEEYHCVNTRVDELEHCAEVSNCENTISPVNSKLAKIETEWFYKLKVAEPNHFVNFKVDTGAQVNIIPEGIFCKLRLRKDALLRSDVRLRTYTGTDIPVIGKCFLNCKTNQGQSHVIEFQVTKVEQSPPILGLPAIQLLGILLRVETIESSLTQYSKVFEGLGDIKVAPYTFVLRPECVVPVATFQRIPFALHGKLRDELDRMLKLTVVEKVNEPTEWLNPIVIVGKPNGEIRVCLDPQPLNAAILREHYRLPTLEEVTVKMKGASYFSTLDANKGFWQIRLTEESSKLTTFDTPSHGRLRFTRLPYGLSCAPEVFHRVFSSLFSDLEGVEIYVDDIIVFGVDKAEHDERLDKVLKRAAETGVTFNHSKCKFGLTEVKYIGHTVSKDGLKVDLDKVKAIQEFTEPTDVKELQRFLGMINYLGKFVPGLSEHTSVLRELCKQDVIWHWTEQHHNAFQDLKNVVTSAPVLQYFDPEGLVTVSVDASQKGLGAVLMQGKGPVAFASKLLSRTQQNYAQIEKELLAVVYGCERFHQYVYGRKVVVETDHKPLEAIFNKPLDKCPLRLQRMRIKLQNYDITLKYKPGKELIVADALSRASGPDEVFDLHEQEIAAQQGLVVHYVQNSPDIVTRLQTEVLGDEIMGQLKEIILKGWPSDKSQIPLSVKPFWTFREDLTVHNGLVYKGVQIVVPNHMRREVLGKIHYNHQGIQKCKLRARECVFWPGMTKEIEDLVNNCMACRAVQNQNCREPQIDKEVPGRPWQIVAADILHFQGKDYLLVVDAYSKYPEFSHLHNLSSGHLVAHCKTVMARHGIPEIFYSDNGPQFRSREFKEFGKQWNFQHRTSSPTYAQSNGLVERNVQTVKKMLKKAVLDRKDIMLSLLEYRNTPLDNHLPSPAQLLFGRRLRGMMPFTTEFLKPELQPNIQADLAVRQHKQKLSYDSQSRELTPLPEGSLVRVRKGDTWQRGQIVKALDRPRSYRIKVESGKEIERNRKHLILDGKGEPFVVANDELEGNSHSFESSHENPCDNRLSNTSRDLIVEGNRDTEGRNHRSEEWEEEIGFKGFEECDVYKHNHNDRGSEIIRSRSGRVVRPPRYLGDYTM